MSESNVAAGDSVKAGYRLEYTEVYNWGTFDEKVWRFTPGAETGLSPATSARASRRSSMP